MALTASTATADTTRAVPARVVVLPELLFFAVSCGEVPFEVQSTNSVNLRAPDSSSWTSGFSSK